MYASNDKMYSLNRNHWTISIYRYISFVRSTVFFFFLFLSLDVYVLCAFCTLFLSLDDMCAGSVFYEHFIWTKLMEFHPAECCESHRKCSIRVRFTLSKYRLVFTYFFFARSLSRSLWIYSSCSLSITRSLLALVLFLHKHKRKISYKNDDACESNNLLSCLHHFLPRIGCKRNKNKRDKLHILSIGDIFVLKKKPEMFHRKWQNRREIYIKSLSLFKGSLFVAQRTRVYNCMWTQPENNSLKQLGGGGGNGVYKIKPRQDKTKMKSTRTSCTAFDVRATKTHITTAQFNHKFHRNFSLSYYFTIFRYFYGVLKRCNCKTHSPYLWVHIMIHAVLRDWLEVYL